MSPFDYTLLVILLLSGLVGALRGLIREALSLAIWILAVWCAARFGEPAARMFATTLQDPLWRLWAGRLALFIAVLFAGSLVAWMIGYVVRRSPVTGTDRVLGTLFGIGRGVILTGILALALELGGFSAEPWWQQSKLLPYATAVGGKLRDAAQEQLARQQGNPL